MNFSMHQVAEIKLTYQTKVPAKDRPKITSSNDAHVLLRNHWSEATMELQEEFKVLLLNRANRVLGLVNLFTGGVSGTVADLKLIFAAALKANASGIIMAHNHPSGNLSASQADLRLTEKCLQAGKILDICILDHVILSTDGYLSMADEGLM